MPFGSIRGLLDTTAVHERNVPTSDAQGGPVAAWTTVTASVKVAIWPIDTEVRNDYARRDIAVTDCVCTDSDLGARPADRIRVGTTYYIVMGLEPYSNTGLLPRPVYIMHCQRRTS